MRHGKELSALTRSEDDRRELIIWAVACAERALPLFEGASRGDDRPPAALAGALAFSRGELPIGAVHQLAVACHAAAREARTPAATAVARACGQAAAVAPMAAHARAVPAYMLKAMARTHSGDPDVLHSQEAWQRGHLPKGFGEFVYPAG